jgi:hypothetical protein
MPPVAAIEFATAGYPSETASDKGGV